MAEAPVCAVKKIHSQFIRLGSQIADPLICHSDLSWAMLQSKIIQRRFFPKPVVRSKQKLTVVPPYKLVGLATPPSISCIYMVLIINIYLINTTDH